MNSVYKVKIKTYTKKLNLNSAQLTQKSQFILKL